LPPRTASSSGTVAEAAIQGLQARFRANDGRTESLVQA
jgi:hypothetical protein